MPTPCFTVIVILLTSYKCESPHIHGLLCNCADGQTLLLESF